jgi:hypothetical protein
MISPRPGAKDARAATAAELGCFSSSETRDSRAAIRPVSGDEHPLPKAAKRIRAAETYLMPPV